MPAARHARHGARHCRGPRQRGGDARAVGPARYTAQLSAHLGIEETVHFLYTMENSINIL